MWNRRLANVGYPRDGLREELDRVFEDVFGGDLLDQRYWPQRQTGLRGRSFPAVNVWESEDKLYAEAEVPGLKLDDLEILIKGDELTIKGERRSGEQEGVTYHRRERGTGPFCSVIRLPVDVEVEGVEASLENGVLMMELPKSAQARPRKIEVKALSS